MNIIKYRFSEILLMSYLTLVLFLTIAK